MVNSSLDSITDMNITKSSKLLFLTTGGYALLCMPAILLAEHYGWPQTPFHLTQIVATLLCFPASVLFLWLTKGTRFSWHRSLGIVAAILSGLWVVFFCYVFLTFDLTAMN